LAADTAVELKKYNIASISLWPGAVLTETIQASENSAGVYINFYYSLENH
jgi:NAD(P)-dependent dehydrogenase (short-subunit alcohol dehydrogenase family)